MNHNKVYKHLFFDLDDTLALSRSPIEPEMKELLTTLPHDIVIVTGGEEARVKVQIGDLPCVLLSQNGNHAIHNDETLWNYVLKPNQKAEILAHIERMEGSRDWDVSDEEDLIDDRGSQISYSLLGHNEHVPKKKAFDPDSNLRLKLLKKFPFRSKTVEVKIGGTTTFDYFEKHKGINIGALINHFDWDANACLYFGDKLHPGGNDESVIGVIDTHEVTDHNHTLDLLKKFFVVTA